MFPLRICQLGVARDERSGCAVAVSDSDLGEFLRILHRQRAHTDGVQQLEDGGIGSNAERQRENRRPRKRRIEPQETQSKLQILPKSFEQGLPAHSTDLLLYTLRAAHFDARGALRCFAAQPAAHLLLDGGLQIAAEFLIQFALGLFLLKQSPQTARKISQ